jgi:hypothetical protein
MPGQLNLSRIQLRKRREVTYGVVDVGQPRVLNIVTEGLQGQPTWVRSAMATAQQLPGPRRRVHVAGAGPVAVELTPGAQMDEFIEEGLGGTFAGDLNISAVTISAAAADNSLNGSGGSEFANVLPGMWVRVLGFSLVPGNNTDGLSGRPYAARVLSKPSNAKIILQYHTLADEIAGPTVTVDGNACRNGTALLSSTIEREHADAATDKFQHYPGQVCAQMEMALAFNEILRATMTYQGKGPRGAAGEASGKSPLSVWDGQTDITEAMHSTVTDASNNLRAFREGGTLSGNLRNLSFTHNLNVEPVMLGMVTEPDCQSLGTKALTGSLAGYLLDADGRIQTAFGASKTDLDVMVIPDASAFGAGVPIYVLSLFQVQYNELGDVPRSAQTGSAVTEFGFECNESDLYPGVWLQVSKIPTV